MTPPPTEPSRQPTSVQTPSSNTLKFSKKQLALAFVIAGISDFIGAFTTAAADRVGSGSCDSAAAFHGAGTAVVAIAGTGPGGHSGRGCTSILAAGGWSDRCPGHSSTEV